MHQIFSVECAKDAARRGDPAPKQRLSSRICTASGQHKGAEFSLLCSALPSVYCVSARVVNPFFVPNTHSVYHSFCHLKSPSERKIRPRKRAGVWNRFLKPSNTPAPVLWDVSGFSFPMHSPAIQKNGGAGRRPAPPSRKRALPCTPGCRGPAGGSADSCGNVRLYRIAWGLDYSMAPTDWRYLMVPLCSSRLPFS